MKKKKKSKREYSIDQIEIEVKKFREACELLKRDICNGSAINDFKTSMSMESFPKNTCVEISQTLAYYLRKKFPGIYLVLIHAWNDLPVTKSSWGGDHKWLETDDGIIIDITLDQFMNVTSRWIVAKESPIHESMRNHKKSNPYSLESFPDNLKRLLTAIEKYVVE